MTKTEAPAETVGQHAGELRIVVGVDGSACADSALRYAVHEASLRGALLHVVSAYHLPPSTGMGMLPLKPFEEAAAVIVSEALDRVHALAPEVVAKGEHVFGAPGPALVIAAREASLIVVGTRGHSEFTGMVLGSVSEYVVHHATCAVTIVR